MDEDVALIEVWNKIDALSPATQQALRNTDKRTEGVQAISALTGEGLDDLTTAIDAALEATLGEPKEPAELRLDFSDGRRRAWLHQAGIVQSEQQDDEGLTVHVLWTERQRATFEAL